MKKVLIVLGVFVLGGIGGIGTTYLLTRPVLREMELRSKEHWRPVVCAVTEIPAGTQITRSMIILFCVPHELIAADAATEIAQVEGRTISRKLMPKDQIRLTDRTQ